MLTANIHRFVILLIRSVHFQMMHARVRDTLVELRQSCWIIKGRQVVKQVLKTCVPCNKIHRRPFQQPTAPLPMDRCSFSQPFDVTGLDFAGPFYLKETKDKAWMCLFTRAVTRAVHLELVRSMSTPCFLMALERFFSRRAIPRIIYSDNARTFKCAARNIAARWRKIDPELALEVGQRGVE
jgi:Integrase zinc binding domain